MTKGLKSKKRGWVLLVEDTMDLATMVTDCLIKSGYKVLVAKTAKEAMGKLGRQEFECVLLDMRLSQGSGEQVISFLRDSNPPFNTRTPIIVISGFLDIDLVKDIKPYVSSILVKPFKVSSLLDRVKDAVESTASLSPSIAKIKAAA